MLFDPSAADLRTPDIAVGASEHAQISAMLDRWTSDLRALDLPRPTLDRPLRPIWVTRASLAQLPVEVAAAREDGVYPLVLCTASGRDIAPEDDLPAGCDYVQGAADDAEAWAYGLTAEVFWEHREALLACDEDGLPALIERLVNETRSACGSIRPPIRIEPGEFVFIGTEVSDTTDRHWDLVVDLRQRSVSSQARESSSAPVGPKVIHHPLEPGKLGSRTLRKVLSPILEGVDQVLSCNPEAKILVVCSTGKDHSVGVALAILSIYASDEGHMQSQRRQEGISKELIKRRLGWIMVSITDANPSRATLQSVNAVLLE